MALIHQQATPKALDFIRSYVFAIWFFIIAYENFIGLSLLPADAFYPAGFLFAFLPREVLPVFLHPAALAGMKIILMAGCLLLIFRKAVRAAGVVVCLLLTLYQGIYRGFGHVSHGENALLFAAILLTLFAIADGFVQHDREGRTPDGVNLNAVALTGVLCFVALTYSFIGLQRLATSGFDIYSTQTLAHSIIRTSHEARMLTFDFAYLMYEWPWLKKMLEWGFPVVNFMEVTAPVVLFSRRYRFMFLAVMIPFHVACLFLMKIFFWENLLLYILFVDFSKASFFKDRG